MKTKKIIKGIVTALLIISMSIGVYGAVMEYYGRAEYSLTLEGIEIEMDYTHLLQEYDWSVNQTLSAGGSNFTEEHLISYVDGMPNNVTVYFTFNEIEGVYPKIIDGSDNVVTSMLLEKGVEYDFDVDIGIDPMIISSNEVITLTIDDGT